MAKGVPTTARRPFGRSLAWARELRDWLASVQRTMPLRHRWLLAALVLVVLSPYTAPVAMGGIAVFAAVRTVRALKSDPSRGFVRAAVAGAAALARESRLFLPGVVLFVSATASAVAYGHWTSLLPTFGLLLPAGVAALWFERTWNRDDALHSTHYATLLLLPIAAAAILQIAFLPVAAYGPRVSGTFGNPNVLAIALELLLPMAMALYYHVWSRTGKAMLLFSISIGWILLYFTGSRSGVLAAIAAAAVFYLCMSDRRPMTIALALVAVVLVAVAIGHEEAIDALKGLIPRLGTITLEIQSRLSLWAIAWTEILRDPWLGRGLASFPLYVQGTAFADRFHCHSLYLGLWLETGLAGVGAVLWMVGSLVVRTVRMLRASPLRPYLSGGLAALTAIFVHGITDMPLMNTQVVALFALLLAGLSVALEPRRAVP